MLQTLYKGNYAKDKLARHVISGAEVTIRITDKSLVNTVRLQKLPREIKIMRMPNHQI